MNVTFIEKIRDYLSRPMIEWTHTEELIGLLVIAVIAGIIWLIGELVHRWEEHKGG